MMAQELRSCEEPEAVIHLADYVHLMHSKCVDTRWATTFLDEVFSALLTGGDELVKLPRV